MSRINNQKTAALRLSNKQSHLLTVEAIEKALLLLMGEKDYASISVTDIVKKAGVSRSAYYRNYRAKDDILNNIVQGVVRRIGVKVADGLRAKDREKCFTALFKEGANEKDTFRLIIASGKEKQLIELLAGLLLNNVDEDDLENRYMVLAWLGSYITIMFDWLKNGMPVSYRQLARICLAQKNRQSSNFALGEAILKTAG